MKQLHGFDVIFPVTASCLPALSLDADGLPIHRPRRNRHAEEQVWCRPRHAGGCPLAPTHWPTRQTARIHAFTTFSATPEAFPTVTDSPNTYVSRSLSKFTSYSYADDDADATLNVTSFSNDGFSDFKLDLSCLSSPPSPPPSPPLPSDYPFSASSPPSSSRRSVSLSTAPSSSLGRARSEWGENGAGGEDVTKDGARRKNRKPATRAWLERDHQLMMSAGWF
ncbi:hypothetical protein B0H14DRAFT_2571520 [Mycena olivaceomarginata]|nr:hypothetical protein B0H14DRAFT_2571520 [Mycena olivaceomarginata]